MAIQKVEDKNKIISSVDLRPKRTYISGSWGVSGSIYVFPNRSATQKDNIDERLNSLGDGITAFSGDSLEARRLEIYEGNFNKFTSSNVDAIAHEYKTNGTDANINFTLAPITANVAFTPESFNLYIKNDPSVMTIGDRITRLKADGSEDIVFVWTSNNNFEVSNDPPEIYNRLPQTHRDRSALNYEIPLALLLDGADPEAFDHAYRTQAAFEANKGTPSYSLGNSSLTGGTKEFFQYTGWNYEMVNGFPYKTSTITSRNEVNPWPPEIEKHGTSIITNYIQQGYSDLSMHPRNKTQKFIDIDRANQDYLGKASSKQRLLYREYSNKNLYDEGWHTKNSHALSLSKWTDGGGVERKPALVYKNENDQYKIDYNSSDVSFHIEFWIKPNALQTDIGCVCQLHNNYAVMLIPDSDSVINDVPQKFSISLRTNEAADDGQTITGDIDHRDSSGTDHVYISSSLLNVEEWHHVSIRWGRNFNNGMLTVYLNNVVIDEFDGINSASHGGISRSGLIDIDSSCITVSKALFIGGYPNTASQQEIWQEFSGAQSGIEWSSAGSGTNTVNADTGHLNNFNVKFTLLSEMTDLRCFDFPRQEEIVTAEWTKRVFDVDKLLFYIPFYFDPSHENYTKRPYLFPSGGALPEELPEGVSANEYLSNIYYSGQNTTIENTFDNDDVQKIQYCQNWGHVAGAPFVHVQSHFKEYVNKEIPVVLAMPNMAKLEPDVYPNYTGTTFADVKILKIRYFVDNWKNIPWLQCWNSLVKPCTLNLGTSPSEIIEESELSFGKSKTIIPLDMVSNFDFDDDKFSAKMLDHDFNLALYEHSPVGEPPIDYPTTNNSNILQQDVLPPFSLVISIPTLYYANRIEHESFIITTKLHGKDIVIVDFNGSLYIADKDNEPTGARIGHISYGFGYLCLFSPLVSGLGLEEMKIEFRGEKSMHVLQFDVRCPPGLGNESKNVNYKKLKATNNSNESDSIVTYISTIYLHDENLNIIGKVKLAQPIQKREEDSFLFRIKMDF